MDGMSGAMEVLPERLAMHSDDLLRILREASQLLDWEGESIVPGGPEEAPIDYMVTHQRSARPLALGLLQALRRLYGAGVARVRRQVQRYAKATETFVSHYGPGEVIIARAPARINILGEHVDYVDYLPTEVLPFASREHDMLMLFRPSTGPRVRGRSTLEWAEPEEFEVADGPGTGDPGDGGSLDDRWLTYLRRVGRPERSWINYVKASVYFCAMKHDGVATGFDFLLDSTVPAAGGASSSSAVVVLAGSAVRVSNGLDFDPESLALDSAKAEWYIGTRGGNMDHCTMCLSRRQHAVHLNFGPFRTELVPLHRFHYRWVTFFAHPADKSDDVLLQYNERSAVSRLVIPALLAELLTNEPELRDRWERVVATLSSDTRDVAAAEEAREILERLPESVTLQEIGDRFASVYDELERSYPQLAQAMGDRPLRVRPRALHHAGEVVRVRQVVSILNEIFSSRMPEERAKTEPGLRAVGELITETHESMRDLYELTTDDIDDLIEIILSHSGVYGARLMGGGFGGNILALITKEHLAEIVNQVQERYYAPRGRDGVAEGSVMVSTPGEGFGLLCLSDMLREVVVNASAIWWKWPVYEPAVERCVCALLGVSSLAEFKPTRPIQPVVVAGARGQDDEPASLSVLRGKTSLGYVLDAIAAMPFPTEPPILVVGPEAADQPLDLPEGTQVVVQPRPLGTGNAVLAALPQIREGAVDVLVVWGSQPLLSSTTLARSVMVHQALGKTAMLFPTAVTHTPYAPTQRDLRGYVIASRETASEGAPTKRLGETNVGAFLLDGKTLKETLNRLHSDFWDDAKGCYSTRSGMLGFPNEMARALVKAGEAVIALPIARVEESLGLRDRARYEEALRLMDGPQA